MKRVLTTAVLSLLLFAIPSPAQQPQRYPSPTYGVEHAPMHTMDEMIAARAKLIERYVKADHYAWGVAVCGEDDYFTGEDMSWLTIYLYSDSLNDFAVDFDKFATRTGNGSLTVDGITVVVEVIQRPKHGDKHEPTIERNDRQPTHSNRRTSTAVSGRPSRA